MIDPAKIPKLQAMWAEADRAFRSDDAFVVDMAEESVKVAKLRAARRARDEAREDALPARDLVDIEWKNAYGARSSQMVPRDKAAAMLRKRIREAQCRE